MVNGRSSCSMLWKRRPFPLQRLVGGDSRSSFQRVTGVTAVPLASVWWIGRPFLLQRMVGGNGRFACQRVVGITAVPLAACGGNGRSPLPAYGGGNGCSPSRHIPHPLNPGKVCVLCPKRRLIYPGRRQNDAVGHSQFVGQGNLCRVDGDFLR